MDFFEHRDKALASSKRLSRMFLLAVIFLSVLLTMVLIVTLPELMMLDFKEYAQAQSRLGRLTAAIEQISPIKVLIVFLGTVLVLCAASFFRTLSLKRRGGRGVAESLGGTLLSPGKTTTTEEKRLLNVVAEMALASGVPTPSVYVLEDETINAFAAGHTVDDAVVGVTKGAMMQLNRQQLQGIIAHEFSHILYGDMKLNLDMIGVLFGISLFQKIGYQLLRSTRGRRNKNSGPVPLIGLGFLVFGSLGYLLASLIRAAISRQREFLADASAVQFTRDPQGISEALAKAANHTLVKSENASEVAHMFFLTAVKGFFAEPFASHPPVRERLQRIGHIKMEDLGAPSDITQRLTNLHNQQAPDRSELGISNFVNAGIEARPTPPEVKVETHKPVPALSIKKAVESIGSLDAQALNRAGSFLSSLPDVIRDALHSPDRSAELILSLALSKESEQQKAQKEILLKTLAQDSVDRIFFFANQGPQSGPRLAFLHLTLPVVKRLSAEAHKKLLALLYDLIVSDRTVELFEFFLFKNVEKYLIENSGRKTQSGRAPLGKSQALSALFTVMATLDSRTASEAKEAYLAGMKSLGLPIDPKLEVEQRDFKHLDKALLVIANLRLEEKKKVLQALAQVAALDDHISLDELELLRGLSIYMGCPMPTVA